MPAKAKMSREEYKRKWNKQRRERWRQDTQEVKIVDPELLKPYFISEIEFKHMRAEYAKMKNIRVFINGFEVNLKGG